MIGEKHEISKKYISCIKVQGVSILPPLISYERRLELQKLKHQAKELEAYIKRKIELKNYLPNNENKSLPPTTSTLEHQLSLYGNATGPHVEFRNSLQKTNSKVPLTIQNIKASRLTCDLQVSQYTNNKFVLLKNTSKVCVCDTLSANSVVLNLAEHFLDKDSCDNEANHIEKISLDNTYCSYNVLSNPSSLSHLTNSNSNSTQIELQNQFIVQSACKSTKNKSLDCTVSSDYISETNDLNITGDVTCTDVSDTRSESKVALDNTIQLLTNDNFKIDTESRFNNIIDNILHNDILLNSDYEETQQKLDDFHNLKSNGLPKKHQLQLQSEALKKNNLICLDYCGPSETRECTRTCSHNQSYCTTSEFLNEYPDKEIVHELNCIENKKQICKITCNQNLISESNMNFERCKQEHAASVIGAAVKGYLIRRLMRTDRVQYLIQTIRDTVICAMRFQLNTTEKINETDVDLHRRLIQQVSSACCAFYNIFFSLPIMMQMAIIRLDRENQKEKLKCQLSNSRISSDRRNRSSRKFIGPK